MMNWFDGLDPRWEGVSIPREHWHFQRRLWDHYSIILEPGEFSWIMTTIRNGDAVLVERQGKTKAVYSVYLRSRRERIYVVAARDVPITSLKPSRRLRELRRAARRTPANPSPKGPEQPD
jgi:hypothetical protein